MDLNARIDDVARGVAALKQSVHATEEILENQKRNLAANEGALLALQQLKNDMAEEEVAAAADTPKAELSVVQGGDAESGGENNSEERKQ